MKFLLRIVFIFIITFFVFCNKEQSHQILPKEYSIPPVEKNLLSQSNRVGFDVFKYLNQNSEEDKNLLISPIGLSISISSLLQFSDIKAGEDIKWFLGISHLPDSSVTKGYESLRHIFSEIDKNTLISENDCYAFRKELDYSTDFKSDISRSQNIHITVDSDPGFIPDAIESSNDFENDGFQLINSLIFKGNARFQKKIEESPFYFNPLKSDFVEMIVSESRYNFYADFSFKAVEIPIGRGNYNMIIIMPSGGQSLNDFALKLNTKLLNKIREKFRSEYLEVYMPKLRISGMESYSDLLKKGRISSCFQTNCSNFPGITLEKNCFWADMEQILDFEISYQSNPELVTSDETMKNEQSDKRTIFIDHPFLFIVYEKYSSGIFFIGKIVNP